MLAVLIGRRLALLEEDKSADRLAMIPITYGCAWDMAAADSAGGDCRRRAINAIRIRLAAAFFAGRDIFGRAFYLQYAYGMEFGVIRIVLWFLLL